MPENTICVTRPGRWENPFAVRPGKTGGWIVSGPGKVMWSDTDTPWTKQQAAEIAVECFRDTIPPRSIRARDAQIELAGKNLACWCAEADPCHADVLLEIANTGPRP